MRNIYPRLGWKFNPFSLTILAFVAGLVTLYGASSTVAYGKETAENNGGSVMDSQSNVQASSPGIDSLLGGERNDAEFRELTGFTVYIDPGHGGPTGIPDCQTFGATGPAGTFEKDHVLNIAFEFGAIVVSHGAAIHYSRTTDVAVCNQSRVDANNAAYRNNNGTSGNWRYISVHLNGDDDVVDTNQTEIFRDSRNANQSALELSNIAKEWLGRLVGAIPSLRQSRSDTLVVLFTSEPVGYNILTESNYLANNSAFENRLRFESGFIRKLGNAHYRFLVEYWLVGVDTTQTRHHEILNEYRNSINAGRDPGVPFANGSTYYVHVYPGDGKAWTQEFNSPEYVRGSILECRLTPCPPAAPTPLPTPGLTPTPNAYYVSNPIWDTYIDKGGPNNDGPGLPLNPTDGREHSWTTYRGARHAPPATPITYPKTQNFARGAITWNDYESQMRFNQPYHATLLPNCGAYDINSSWATTNLKNMVGRFAISNDAAESPPRPTPPPGVPAAAAGYYDGGLHPNDEATRAELAQSLIFAEGYGYYTGSSYEYGDIQDHRMRPWIRIAASLGIATGYTDQEWRPDNKVTRGQFAKMESIARSWQLVNPTPYRCSTTCPCSPGTTSGYYSFSDVCYGDTFYQHIETVKAHNAIGGYDDGTFRWGNNVTRAQMSKIIDDALSNDSFPAPSQPCW